jgi:uncharacterized protein (DUF362 family)
MEITQESSMREYNRLLEDPLIGPLVPLKPSHPNPYSVDGKYVVAVVRTESRKEGIIEAIRMIGGIKPLCEGVRGEILIKPNCNTDDPFPRDTHPETVRFIIKSLLEVGFPAERIVVGDMSGRRRGLPTRYTIANLGITEVADELGVKLSYFEEEGWVKVKHPHSRKWPNGILVPQRIYDAERIILTPIMRPHSNATFTISLKLAVGLIEAQGREWLHNGEEFFEKMIELNLAYQADLVVSDAMKILTDRDLSCKSIADPGIVITGSNRVAADAVSVALMKHYGVHGVSERFVLDHEQFKLANKLGLGSPRLGNIILKTMNLAEDEVFDGVISTMRSELSLRK